jgi:uncharacterized phage protein (TIGR01671 family)
MNRELKFRAWDADDEEIYYPLVFASAEGVPLKPLRNCKDGNRAYKDHVLMQFTGLKDKNDKEIYEGDIMKGWWSNDATVVVLYKNGSTCYEYTDKGNSKETFLLEKSYCEESEIVGNIFKHPQLLHTGALAGNVLGLGEEGEFEIQMFNSLLMPNRSTMFKVCTSAPFLPNPCYMKCQLI